MGRLRDLLTGRSANYAAPTRTYIGFPTADAGLVGSGVSVTTALGLSSVWRCLDILSSAVSQLHWRELRGNLELPPSRIVRRPDADYSRRDWVSVMVNTAALFDVAYALKAGGVDSEGVPLSLIWLDPRIVQPISTDAYQIRPPAEFWVGTERVRRDQLVIMHRSPQPGVPDDLGGVLRLARINFAAAIASEGYASRYWQAGGAPLTLIELDKPIVSGQGQAISDEFTSRRQLGPDYPVVLGGGAKARSFGADPTQQAAVEARREQVADIGRYFGIPTRILNAPTGDSETYSSSEMANQDLVRYTLANYIGMIEDAVSDLLPGGRYVQMDTRKLTGSTRLATAQEIQILRQAGMISVDEGRETLGLPPIEDPSMLEPLPTAPPVAASAPVFNLTMPQPPDIAVTTPPVNVVAGDAVLKVDAAEIAEAVGARMAELAKPTRKRIERNKAGLITAIVEE